MKLWRAPSSNRKIMRVELQKSAQSNEKLVELEVVDQIKWLERRRNGEMEALL